MLSERAMLPVSAVKPVPKNAKNKKTRKSRAFNNNNIDLDQKSGGFYQLPKRFVSSNQMNFKNDSPCSSMSSSSCGSIEREADNQENLDELTLEEQAMTYGLSEAAQPAEQLPRGNGKAAHYVEMEYQDIESAMGVASDSSKVVSGLFTTSVPRSKNSAEEDTQCSGHQATSIRFIPNCQNSC